MKFNTSLRKDWKSLFEGNLARILLKQLDYSLEISEFIVDSAFDLINYHLKEIRAHNKVVIAVFI